MEASDGALSPLTPVGGLVQVSKPFLSFCDSPELDALARMACTYAGHFLCSRKRPHWPADEAEAARTDYLAKCVVPPASSFHIP